MVCETGKCSIPFLSDLETLLEILKKSRGFSLTNIGFSYEINN